MKLIIKHGRKLSTETINQALNMHGLIATNTEQLVKGKTDQNSIVITKPQRELCLILKRKQH